MDGTATTASNTGADSKAALQTLIRRLSDDPPATLRFTKKGAHSLVFADTNRHTEVPNGFYVSSFQDQKLKDARPIFYTHRTRCIFNQVFEKMGLTIPYTHTGKEGFWISEQAMQELLSVNLCTRVGNDLRINFPFVSDKARARTVCAELLTAAGEEFHGLAKGIAIAAKHSSCNSPNVPMTITLKNMADAAQPLVPALNMIGLLEAFQAAAVQAQGRGR